LLCLVVVFVVFVRIRLLNFPLERDEGEFAYVAQLALDGVGPYQLAYVVKLPGTYLAYTVIMGLFGQTTAAIHLGFLLVNLANLAVFYRVARRFLEIPNAMIGCACFALLSLSPGVLGLQGHATNLVVLAALGGMDCLLRARESGRGSLFWWSGLCFGLAFLFKQPGLFFGVLAVAVLFRDAAQERPARWRRCLGRVGLLAAGIAAPLALVCVAMLAAGVFDRFWFWTFRYAAVRAAMPSAEVAAVNLQLFSRQMGIDKWIWPLPAVGLLCLWRGHASRDAKFFVTALLFFSGLAFVAGLKFNLHYFLVMLPVISLLIAMGMAAGMDAARGKSSSWLPMALFALGCACMIWAHRDIWLEANPDEASRIIYATNPFVESVEVAKYIREHSPPEARIAVMGSEPQIYFYAHRHSASGYINMYDLVEAQPYASQMQESLLRDIQTVRPEYLIRVKVPLSWGPWSVDDESSLIKLDEYARKFYEVDGFVALFPDHADYTWGPEAAGKTSATGEYIIVMKRNKVPSIN
jgi:4-amino-4-deoxy-L-arabinose transferase-like glycosyltransferase